MLKKKRISLIILIITIFILLVAVVVGIILINGNKNEHVSESAISYINSKNGQNNKLALLLKSGSEIEYVLAIKFDKKINLSNDYLEDIYNNNLNIIIKDDYRFELNLEDIEIDIDDEDIDNNDEILKQKDNWYLVKWSDEYTKICLKIQNPKYSWDTNWVSFEISDSDGNEINERYFDKLTEMANVYTVSDNENLTFTDFNNNIIDLSDYTFLNDHIARSLTKYGIYLKNPCQIEIDAMEDEILYSSEDDLYFIRVCDSKEYNKVCSEYTKLKTFKYNGEEFEVFTKESDYSGYHIGVYKIIDNGKYLEISEIVDDINDVENIINTITKELF